MENLKIAVIGLGYIGLPLAKLLSTQFPVVGFDIKHEKIEELNKGYNIDLQETDHLLISLLVYENPFTTGEDQGVFCTTDINAIKDANVYFIAISTIDKNNNINYDAAIKATEYVGKVLKKGDLIIYKSVSQPEVLEKKCFPILEEISKFNANTDFFVKYTPN